MANTPIFTLRINPIDKKMRYYKMNENGINQIKYDFNKEELIDSFISIIFKGVVIGHINTINFLNELYGNA